MNETNDPTSASTTATPADLGEWTEWSQCSVTCGDNGLQVRSRIGDARAAVDVLLGLREVVREVYRLGDQMNLEKSRRICTEI